MVLRQLAGILKGTLRSNEPLYRFGGEEFLWLLQCKSAAEAEQSAQRLLSAVRGAAVPIPDGALLALTVTLGLARVREQDDLSSAIMRADLALYDGKKSGRDRYVIADP
ncbi:diguanylate cyclase [Thiobacillus sp.]|uniref:diguanylate cyclase n=1 Tax=Thiobacillus sp. TaxID=924 RepID=UPI0025DAD521|nr:diguanylate cyclase [Thiobacillus sp.]